MVQCSLLSFLFVLLFSESLIACSSCGAGVGDRFTLSPEQNGKVYFAISGQEGVQDNVLGESVNLAGTDKYNTAYLGGGIRISSAAFVVAGLPYVENVHGERSSKGLGDPTVGGRYTIARQAEEHPMMPEVEVMSTFKMGMAAAEDDSDDPELLDVHGNGFDELRLGLDVWWLFHHVFFGAGYSETFAFFEMRDGEKIQPGTLARSNGTIGYMDDSYKLTTGLVLYRRGKSRRNDEPVGGTMQKKHNAFINLEYTLSHQDSMGLSFIKEGVILSMKNAQTLSSLALSWSRAL